MPLKRCTGRAATIGIDMRVDDGEMVVVGKLRLRVLYAGPYARLDVPGRRDRVFTGDTLLIGGTGRTDLPTGDEQLHHSLFDKLLRLDPATLVYPAHDYKGRSHSTIGDEIANNPRLKAQDRAAFVEMMRLNLTMPTHITGRCAISRAARRWGRCWPRAAAAFPFMALDELNSPPAAQRVRPRRARRARARRLRNRPRSRRAAPAARPARTARRRRAARPDAARADVLRVRPHLDARRGDLRTLGFQRAVALDGGMKTWRDAGYPVRTGNQPRRRLPARQGRTQALLTSARRSSRRSKVAASAKVVVTPTRRAGRARTRLRGSRRATQDHRC